LLEDDFHAHLIPFLEIISYKFLTPKTGLVGLANDIIKLAGLKLVCILKEERRSRQSISHGQLKFFLSIGLRQYPAMIDNFPRRRMQLYDKGIER